MRTSIETLFPTPVVFYRWQDGIDDYEKSFLNNLDQRSNEGNTTSQDSYLFKQSQLQRIKTFAQDCVDDYVQNIICPSDPDLKLFLTQAWANYTKPGQFHHKHCHPNSVISGVFYINAESANDRIKFFNDGYQQLKPNVGNWNLFNSESWWFPVETNQLILFPSHQVHMVETVQGDHQRVSLAFNTFWAGFLGEQVQLTHLDLNNLNEIR